MFEADFENGRLWRKSSGKELKSKTKAGYAVAKIDRVAFYRHRILMKMWMKDSFDESLVVHHKNSKRGDDRINNLALVTQQENREAATVEANGRCGAWYRKEAHRWTAAVYKDRQINLGLFAMEGMALLARKAALEHIKSGGSLKDVRRVSRDAVNKAYGFDCFASVGDLVILVDKNYNKTTDNEP
jgi:hypothetical protein